MTAAYTMGFLFLFLLNGGWTGPLAEAGYKLAPAEAVALPYDAGRLAPWAADQRSAFPGYGDTSLIDAPADTRSSYQVVAAEPGVEALKKENEELRQRLEKLEQLMKNTLSEPPVNGAQSEEAGTDRKSVPGWRVELHDWSKDGILKADAKKTLLTQNCPFTGRFAQDNPMQMHLYRFHGVFRAKQNGRYVFASDMVCGFGHKCGFNVYVDNQPLIEFKNNTDGTRLVNGLPLTAGDHELEFHTWLTSNNFIKYSPGDKFKWHVLVKGPDDITPREFEPDELFTVVPRNVNMAARPCEL
ncbi:hypothetical protein LJR030_003627 [Rhizobium sp. LjRoot30]|uniref:hypothetical protein n=1 Tax=Rhizobium sp. LjRoot30 TaxID=3342320 RepID=UPI003ECE95BC